MRLRVVRSHARTPACPAPSAPADTPAKPMPEAMPGAEAAVIVPIGFELR
jgi:hypothetical protein